MHTGVRRHRFRSEIIVSQIPAWRLTGLLPAVDPKNPTARRRSPYRASLLDTVAKFGRTPNRRKLLQGLLEYRERLHAAGLTRGFQWVDGSFVEDVEQTEGRPPGDIDVITFIHVTDDQQEMDVLEQYPDLFEPNTIRKIHGLHAYHVVMNPAKIDELVDDLTYWYSLWSHTRDGVWKGYVRIDLAEGEDHAARSELDKLDREGGQ